eukprot:4594817-Alexandrium_andersonii.AAC.1
MHRARRRGTGQEAEHQPRPNIWRTLTPALANLTTRGPRGPLEATGRVRIGLSGLENCLLYTSDAAD